MDLEIAAHDLIDLIYRAAGDRTVWPAVAEQLGGLVGGTAATVHHQQSASCESNFFASWNVDPSALDDYTRYYGFRNPLMTTRPELIKTGSVNTSDMLCPEETFLKSEYYNDYFSQLGLYHCLAATLASDGATSSNLTIFRPIGAERFDERERKTALLFVRHLQQAFQLHNRLLKLQDKVSVIEEAFNCLPTAMAIVDSSGKVLMVNRAAETFFRQQRYLVLASFRIRATRAAEDRILQELIKNAGSDATRRDYYPGGDMKISRESQRPLHILVSPLRYGPLSSLHRCRGAAILICDPEYKLSIAAEQLARAYRLTPAEGRLAQLLAAGHDLRSASEELQVAVSTVRSQLKTIFEKTDTRRQAELVRLLILASGQLQQAFQ